MTFGSSTATKWISTNGELRYPGDLFHNDALYYPRPDYKDPYWKLQHILAEKFSSDRSIFKEGYRSQAMFYAAASNGRLAYHLAKRYPEKVLQHSVRLTKDGDRPFLTTQRLAEALDASVMGPDVFAQNYRNNAIATALASENLRNPETGKRDVYVVGPVQREEMLRALKRTLSISRGTFLEDATFEKHLWGPFCEFDVTHGIYHGDHAWSRNAAMEKGLGLAIQYGAPLPLHYRSGIGFDAVDLWGRPVSLVDQAWEDARHIVDVVSDGFRTEPAVALLMTRFMYDHYYQTKQGDLERDHVNRIVRDHYNSVAEMQKMKRLQDLMLPYMTEFCDWPTLHDALDSDPDLRRYWDEHVEPSRGKLKAENEIVTELLSYVPRGGYDGEDLRRKAAVAARRDPPKFYYGFNMNSQPARPPGQRKDPFSREFDPKRFNDRNFAKLGGGNRNDDPDPAHLNFAQGAVIMTLAGMLDDGLRPPDASRVLIYLDDAGNGYRPAAYLEEQHIDHPGEAAAIKDPLANGSETFNQAVAAENGPDLQDRVRQLGLHQSAEAWRAALGVGNIVPVSKLQGSLGSYHKGYREATDTMLSTGIAASGSTKLGGAAEEAVMRRYIGQEANGLIIPAGELSARSYRYVMEAVLSTVGLIPRAYEGGKGDFEFFIDHDYNKPPHERGMPQKVDLGDLVLHLGMKVKAELEKPNPPKLKDQYVTMARLLYVYDLLKDPARLNHEGSRDVLSGKDSKKEVIDWANIKDPSFIAFIMDSPGMPPLLDDKDSKNPDIDAVLSDPGYIAFAQKENDKPQDFYERIYADTVAKAQGVEHLRTWMLSVPVKGVPVQGNLLMRGIHAFDKDDLIDLPDEYDKARSWWHNLSARERTNIFKQGVVHVAGPAVVRPS